MAAKPLLNLNIKLSYTCPRTGDSVELDGHEAKSVLMPWSYDGDEDRYGDSGIEISIGKCKSCGKSHDREYLM
jgi:hypothetical protein